MHIGIGRLIFHDALLLASVCAFRFSRLAQDPTPGSIAWGCCEILKNFEHARWMGSRGRVTAAFSFSWDSIAQQTREIYYEQRNKHDAPPNWTYSTDGDETLAFALIGPVGVLLPVILFCIVSKIHSSPCLLFVSNFFPAFVWIIVCLGTVSSCLLLSCRHHLLYSPLSLTADE